jgi:hypothetical protein
MLELRHAPVQLPVVDSYATRSHYYCTATVFSKSLQIARRWYFSPVGVTVVAAAA